MIRNWIKKIVKIKMTMNGNKRNWYNWYNIDYFGLLFKTLN